MGDECHPPFAPPQRNKLKATWEHLLGGGNMPTSNSLGHWDESEFEHQTCPKPSHQSPIKLPDLLDLKDRWGAHPNGAHIPHAETCWQKPQDFFSAIQADGEAARQSWCFVWPVFEQEKRRWAMVGLIILIHG